MSIPNPSAKSVNASSVGASTVKEPLILLKTPCNSAATTAASR